MKEAHGDQQYMSKRHHSREIYKRKGKRQVVDDLDGATYLYSSALTHATSLGRFTCIDHISNSFKPIHKLKVVLKEQYREKKTIKQEASSS